MWGAITKALNSTVGTKFFKPLNELYFLGKTVVPSDNLLFVIDDEQKENNFNYTKALTMKTNGAFRVSAEFETYYSSTATIRIYKNGELYKSVAAGAEDSGTKTTDVAFSKNDVLTFGVSISGSSGASVSNLRLYGDIKDISIFDINENEVVE